MNKAMLPRLLLMAIGAALLAACASQPQKPTKPLTHEQLFGHEKADAHVKAVAADPSDPFQGFNRAMWAVNYDAFDPYVAKPIAHGYVDYVPQPMRSGVSNFVDNFNEPSSMVNHLLIGDFKDAGVNLVRFVLNTTVGMLGFVDVAGHMGLTQRTMSFGDVMGYAEIGQGAYLMLPFYGPTTVRNLAGNVVDDLYFPYNLMTLPMKVGRLALKGLSVRADLIPQEPLLDNSIDPYAFSKGAYMQYQQATIHQIKVSNGAIPADQPVQHKANEEVSSYLDEIDD
ncbi:MlaA family lipoprotein [Dongshaea marina]|uniref:MlaA family lipoprotein n=1 Tax=Dongshaea marina TaxID=2047966 RepID=UPI001F216776|nr:VacJ family lipoprotein [Dongshaea marina]